MDTGIKLVIGIGNPGTIYAKTRHNVGVWFVDMLAKKYAATFHKERKFLGELAKESLIWLLKPSTFMNDSGQSVSAVVRFYKVKPDNILIAHDELDFPVGTVRLKRDGGHGGHNGLRSIMQHLGMSDFYRLRIGIGHPGDRVKVTSFVLSAPTSDEAISIQRVLKQVVSVIPCLLEGDMERFMRELH